MSQTNAHHEAGPAIVHRYLQGVEYPASRQELIAEARTAGAPPEVTDALERLPAADYGSLAEVSEAVAQEHFGLELEEEPEEGLVIGPEEREGPSL